MNLARFCYDVAPTNRERALDCIRQEAKAAREHGLNARVLVPLTRAHGGAALQFENRAHEPRSTGRISSPGCGLKKRDQRLDACL